MVVKFSPAYVAVAWLACLAAGIAQTESFTFAGFQRDMDLASLLDRYPRSSHEVTPGGGVPRRTSEDDLKEWMRRFFSARGSSGTYVLRLTPDESHDHVYYVQAELREGVTERLWLLFERPLGPAATPRRSVGDNEARYPACDDVLKLLEMKYGKPRELGPRREEALDSFEFVWTHAAEVMTLQCGRYQGRETVFAIGVTLEKITPR
jgi:hypothetical protein